MSENGISDTISRAVDRARHHAQDELPDGAETTLNLILWDDGDFSIEILHALDVPHPEIKGRECIFYHSGEGTFGYRHTEERLGWRSDRVVDERVLEVYP